MNLDNSKIAVVHTGIVTIYKINNPKQTRALCTVRLSSFYCHKCGYKRDKGVGVQGCIFMPQ